MKGELHLNKQLRLRRTILLMDDRVELICCFSGAATSRDSNEFAMKLPRGAIIPVVRS